MNDDSSDKDASSEETISQRPIARGAARGSQRPGPPQERSAGQRDSRPPSESQAVATSGPEVASEGPPSVIPSTQPGSTGDTPRSGGELDDALSQIIITEEATRAKAFAMLCIVVSSLALGCLSFLGGDPTARAICGVALVAIIATSIWTHWRLNQPRPRLTVTMRIFGAVAVHAVLAVEFYMGFLSPVTVVMSLGVYYVSMSRDTLFATLFAGHLILGWSVGATLMATGVLEDRGLFRQSDLPPERIAFAVVAVTMTLATASWAARLSRRALHHAIRTAHEALVQVDNREAQLAEAQNQLDRAIRLAVGQPGRYTGQVAGQHVLDVIIGFGAMGEVYSAESCIDSAASAVKLLRPEALQDETLVDRFLREASIYQRLAHPNVVGIREVGRMGDGAPFMAMELLQGQDLAAILRRRDRLPWPELIDLARSLAGALDHAHEAGVIHRDLKPHNIFQVVGQDGQRVWKILDFGISKLVSAQATLTQDSVVGTPSYMSPEQAQARPIDHRSDLFAMASVIYRAATGRPAFPGKDTPSIMFDVVYRMPQRPTTVVHDLPAEIDIVLAIGMAKAPEDRFASAHDFFVGLEAIGGDGLDARLERRARKLLAKHPWGQSTGFLRGEPSGGFLLNT
ncbi:MAG: serine/threonine-protein kinase [Myxococcales bacterium]|nr:serine/threonine-protein kinase [Myxococcales bacterium]